MLLLPVTSAKPFNLRNSVS